jgi:hypothetical protein
MKLKMISQHQNYPSISIVLKTMKTLSLSLSLSLSLLYIYIYILFNVDVGKGEKENYTKIKNKGDIAFIKAVGHGSNK